MNWLNIFLLNNFEISSFKIEAKPDNKPNQFFTGLKWKSQIYKNV